jgi:hypothetical protein
VVAGVTAAIGSDTEDILEMLPRAVVLVEATPTAMLQITMTTPVKIYAKKSVSRLSLM